MLELNNCTVALSVAFTLHVASCQIKAGKHMALVGKNGSGKSALAAVMAGQGDVVSGERNIAATVGWVSVAQQQALIAKERQKDDADILDVVPIPSTATEVIWSDIDAASTTQQQLYDALVDGLRMGHFLNNAFLGLSTGETRKVLLVKTLLSQPELLILDEPWDGLDTDSSAFLANFLTEHAHHTTIVVVINRLSEMPAFINQVLFMQDLQIAWTSTGDILSDHDRAQLTQLLHLESVVPQLPVQDETRYSPKMQANETQLVTLKEGRVSYDNRVIFEHLNWQINQGEHWQVIGPNGSGKTCLLSMITGDDPHCYTNDLRVFGYTRGSGESIWDIKQHIGLVSNSFHLQYRVNCSLLHVVLSGFFDSIGLYEQPTVKQKQLAREWLQIAGMADKANSPFQTLSFGDQRLLLIIRAMVKHPTLLILDEPCNGLDEINRLKVLSLLGIIAEGGESTLLYVNHHAEDRINGITRVLNMQDFAPS